MSSLPHILFCESPFDKNKVDPDFNGEFSSAVSNGFKTMIFNFDDFINSNDYKSGTRRISTTSELTPIIYRGWMLTPKQYAALYNELLSKNFKLFNNSTEYQNCHYLPDSLRFIESYTPKTVFEKLSNENSRSRLMEKAKKFGNNAVIVKDYVKSEKHDWYTACFVENASDSVKLNQTIENLIQLRGNYLNEGIVIRDYVPLKELTMHSKSGMPLKEEYRLFFCNGRLVGIYDYWEEGEYDLLRPDITLFEEIARNIESNFFSMDIARQANGELIIIELGDGQVSGLPDRTDKNNFYKELKSCFHAV